jgi:hypothetical protein
MSLLKCLFQATPSDSLNMGCSALVAQLPNFWLRTTPKPWHGYCKLIIPFPLFISLPSPVNITVLTGKLSVRQQATCTE